MLVVVACVLHAGCGHHDSSVAVAVHAVDPKRGVTHGGSITMVAVTEAGDAALSVDDLGEIRLWPSLDGKHPPVPVVEVAVEQMALGYANGDFLAAVLSEAGDVLLLQLGHDGVVHGRTQIPGDVACEQVIAVGDGVVVVRADHSIERYDATAHRRARIVARPGEQIVALAVRHGRAVALLSDNVGDVTLAREIALDGGLRWGRSRELPPGVTGKTLALARDGRFLAVLTGATVEVFELASGEQVGPDMNLDSPRGEIGFTDDDHLAVLASEIQWWPHRLQHGVGISGGAVGDGVAIGGLGASLAISSGQKTRYLGWTHAARGELGVIDSHVVMTDRVTATWLDDRLALASESEVGGTDEVVWLGPHHVVRYGRSKTFLVDIDHPESAVALANVRTTYVFYNSALHELALFGEGGKLARFTLDLEHTSVTELAPLDVSPTFNTQLCGSIELLDPARAGGVVAIAHWSRPARVAFYSGPTAFRELAVAEVLAVDGAGALYYRSVEHGPIFKRTGDSEITLAGIDATALVPSHDGVLLAAVDEHELALYDAAGTKRWALPLVAPSQVVFSSDDHVVVVHSAGGLASFDAATGSPLSEACAFGFGLHDDRPVIATLQAEPVCDGL